MIQTVSGSLSSPECPHERNIIASFCGPLVLMTVADLHLFLVHSSFIIPNPLPDPARYLCLSFLCSIPFNLVYALPVVSLLDVCLDVC